MDRQCISLPADSVKAPTFQVTVKEDPLQEDNLEIHNEGE